MLNGTLFDEKWFLTIRLKKRKTKYREFQWTAVVLPMQLLQ